MIAIRRAIAGDAGDIAAIHIGSWQVAYQDIFPDRFLSSLDKGRRTGWLRDQIESGRDILVSEADSRITGFCMFGPSHESAWGEIHAIYVNPDDWSLGHGRLLFDEACRALSEGGFERMLLWVLEDNDRGRVFYERQGMILGKPIRIEEIGGVQVTELRYELEFRAVS